MIRDIWLACRTTDGLLAHHRDPQPKYIRQSLLGVAYEVGSIAVRDAKVAAHHFARRFVCEARLVQRPRVDASLQHKLLVLSWSRISHGLLPSLWHLELHGVFACRSGAVTSNKASNRRQVSSYMKTNTGGHPAAFSASMVRPAVFTQGIRRRDCMGKRILFIQVVRG